MERTKEKIHDLNNLFNFIGEYESVNRFSRNHLVKPENLVHHVGVVSIISAYLLNKISEYYEIELFSTQECCSLMMRAVVHDLEELITGDIIRPTKYASPAILDLLKKLEEESVGKVIEKFDLPTRWEEDWRQAKKDNIGILLKVADTLAVIMTCYREIKLYSNNQFIKVARECYDYIEDMKNFLDVELSRTKNDEKLFKIYYFLHDITAQGSNILRDVIPTGDSNDR